MTQAYPAKLVRLMLGFAPGGGTSETLRNLIGRKLVKDMGLATGVPGMGTF